MCECCLSVTSIILSYGSLMCVVLNIKYIPRLLSFIREKKKEYFLLAAGLATFVCVTTLFLMCG